MNLVLLVSLSLLLTGGDPGIVQVREMYKQAPAKESYCKQLLQDLKPVNVQQPLLYGYKGCATMIMAKHAFNPLNKWSYFRKGKNMLEQAITKDPGNIELRYLRITVQSNAPGFLGYKDKINTDKQFIRDNIGRITDPQLVSMVRSVI